jgi:mannose-6-phosphate isomerase-like protein (cupin superfamily)
VVTGHDAEGRPAIVADGPLPHFVERQAVPGMADGVVWATGPEPSAPHDGADPTAAVGSVVPGPGETRFLTVTLPPAAVFEAGDFDPAAAAAEDAEVVPGLAELIDPADPGMHRTPTVDYVIVLEGEVWLEMDGGEGTLLRQGDVVVQNSTRHAWRNKGEVPVTLASILIGVAADGLRSQKSSDSDENCERKAGPGGAA